MKISKKSKPNMKAVPQKKAQQKADQAALMAIAGGDVMKDLQSRKTDQDSRTLYIRFPGKQPQTAQEIKELHSDIKFVRTPRISSKQRVGIGYAFIEFGDTEECKAAKDILATTQFKGSEVYVDFVGENSKAKKITKPLAQLNPTRLFVSGLRQGVDNSALKEMFPKAGSACIPQRSKKKGTTYGFVQFSKPADAKAAFDAAQDLTIANHKITVLFAKMTDAKQDVQKAKERKANADKRKARKEAINVTKKEPAVKIEDEDSAKDNMDYSLNMEVGKDDDVKVFNIVIKKENIGGTHTEIRKSENDIDETVAEMDEEDKNNEVRDGSEGEENVQMGGYEDDE